MEHASGAGTSEHVGKSAQVALNDILGHHVHAYGTTDLVVDLEKYLSKEKPTLLISFARSGNSPGICGCGGYIYSYLSEYIPRIYLL